MTTTMTTTTTTMTTTTTTTTTIATHFLVQSSPVWGTDFSKMFRKVIFEQQQPSQKLQQRLTLSMTPDHKYAGGFKLQISCLCVLFRIPSWRQHEGFTALWKSNVWNQLQVERYSIKGFYWPKRYSINLPDSNLWVVDYLTHHDQIEEGAGPPSATQSWLILDDVLRLELFLNSFTLAGLN